MAQSLGVETLLLGSLAVDDERLNVQVQLIDANSGNNLLGTPL